MYPGPELQLYMMPDERLVHRLEQRYQRIGREIMAARIWQEDIERGVLKPAENAFSPRAASFRLVMHTWRPNPREVERNAALKTVNPQPGQQGIEIGSGDGFLTESLVRATESIVIAAEPSSRQQAFLRVRAAKWDPEYAGLAIPAPLSPDSPEFLGYCIANGYEGIDYAVGLASWHHVPDQKALIENLARILRVGGVVGGADVVNGSRLWRMFTEFLPEYVVGGHEGTYLDRARLESLCQGTPFAVEMVRERVMKWQPFKSECDMGAFIVGLHCIDRLDFQEVAEQVKKYLDFQYNEVRQKGVLYWDSLVLFRLRKVREWQPS